MMKNFGKITLLLFLFCVSLFCLTGCRSAAYYRARAAEDARVFLLKNAPELTAEQAAFVKYNDPVLLTSPVLGTPLTVDRNEKKTSYLHQFYVTWNIPGAKNLYMVFGVSDSRMYSWQPIRLIRKDFTQKPMPEDSAIALCRQYAVNSLLPSLSVAALNRVRFEFPYIARTRFELNFNTTGKMTAEEVLDAQKAAAGKFQYSLYWKNPDGSATVFCGLSDVKLAGWSLNFAGVVQKAELAKSIIGVVRTPAQFNENITIRKEDAARKMATK